MDNAFGKRLKILRKEHHITQVQLAERMDQTESNIRNYELGKAFPRIPGLMVLPEMFGVSTDFLLGLSDVRDGNRMDRHSFSNVIVTKADERGKGCIIRLLIVL